MIQLFNTKNHSLEPVELEKIKRQPKLLKNTVWIDLLRPTAEEVEFIQKQLQLEIPTQEEMSEIEESSRLFVENKALFMSCWLLCFDSQIPLNTSITFILNSTHLTSLRYSDHHLFRIFSQNQRLLQPGSFGSATEALVELIDAVAGQNASSLRHIEESLNHISLEIFSEQTGGEKKPKPVLKNVVQRLGKRNSLLSSLRESSMSFQKIARFMMGNSEGSILPGQIERIRLIEKDIRSLREYDSQLSAEISFLLDSTVGLISQQQNESMKILSLAALILAII